MISQVVCIVNRKESGTATLTRTKDNILSSFSVLRRGGGGGGGGIGCTSFPDRTENDLVSL